jgi:hypothetical protein
MPPVPAHPTPICKTMRGFGLSPVSDSSEAGIGERPNLVGYVFCGRNVHLGARPYMVLDRFFRRPLHFGVRQFTHINTSLAYLPLPGYRETRTGEPPCAVSFPAGKHSLRMAAGKAHTQGGLSNGRKWHDRHRLLQPRAQYHARSSTARRGATGDHPFPAGSSLRAGCRPGPTCPEVADTAHAQTASPVTSSAEAAFREGRLPHLVTSNVRPASVHLSANVLHC